MWGQTAKMYIVQLRKKTGALDYTQNTNFSVKSLTLNYLKCRNIYKKLASTLTDLLLVPLESIFD